jgi:hypothetical protein
MTPFQRLVLKGLVTCISLLRGISKIEVSNSYAMQVQRELDEAWREE